MLGESVDLRILHGLPKRMAQEKRVDPWPSALLLPEIARLPREASQPQAQKAVFPVTVGRALSATGIRQTFLSPEPRCLSPGKARRAAKVGWSPPVLPLLSTKIRHL